MHIRGTVYAAIAASVLVGVSSSGVRAQTLVHDYELNGSYADSLGGPAIVSDGGTLGANVYTFGVNQGLTLSNAISPADYSIFFRSSLDSTNGYKKFVDFKNLASDNGLYNLSTDLNFYPTAFGPNGAFADGQYADVVLTRDGASNVVTGYVNGAQQFSFTDTGNIGVFDSPNAIAHFFEDDAATGGREASSGAVDFIRIYDGALNANQVGALTDGSPITSTVPEPSQTVTFAFGLLGLAALALRGRKARNNS